MVSSITTFSDIQNHWARPFIEALAQRGIISGFPNGTFRPNESITRSHFAAIINKAFNRPKKRQYITFIDVASNNWAAPAIQKAFEMGFLSGFPNNRFRPDDRIARVQVLVALVNGLEMAEKISPDGINLAQIYQDFQEIPNYGTQAIAIATRANIVVNFPNLKILNPNGAVTRAEVAAFIYQALVYLEQVPKITSNYIVTHQITINVSHKREFRGVWITTVSNLDWPSKPGLSTEQQKAELITILDRLQSINCNALILQVRAEGDALYNSKIEPWSAVLTGTQGKPPDPYYDPLEFAIIESHKRNIELHAWFNPYRAKTNIKGTPNVTPHIAITNPEYVYQWGNQLWMEPGAKYIQDLTYNVILDVVQRYDIDGIHLDDYFYPYPIAGQTFPDAKVYAAYQSNGGKLSLKDWRRENVNNMVLRLATGIRNAKPHVKFGISPFGIYRPGQPPGIKGLDQYDELFADVKKWLEEGWMDYCAPQLYWRIDQTAQSYPVLLEWWLQQNAKRRHIYIGNNISLLDGKTWTLAEITKQIDITRNQFANLALGNIFYRLKFLNENRQNIYDNFKTSTYIQPALVPVMEWLNNKPPEPPQGVEGKDGKLMWNRGNDSIRAWSIYQQNGNTWNLINILPGAINFVNVTAGVYAVCAVDRMSNESAGVVVNVK